MISIVSHFKIANVLFWDFNIILNMLNSNTEKWKKHSFEKKVLRKFLFFKTKTRQKTKKMDSLGF